MKHVTMAVMMMAFGALSAQAQQVKQHAAALADIAFDEGGGGGGGYGGGGDTIPPGSFTLSVTPSTATELSAQWDTPADNVGVTAFDVRYGEPGTPFAQMTPAVDFYSGGSAPAPVGETNYMTLCGLVDGHTYDVIVRATDAASNPSDESGSSTTMTASVTGGIDPGNGGGSGGGSASAGCSSSGHAAGWMTALLAGSALVALMRRQ